jgi:RNA polymerase sigma factor (sigma-70 family)
MQDRNVKAEFTKVFEEESDALFRFAYSRTSDRELAIEISQESFTRLWQKFVLEGEVPNPRAFLYVVARHLIIDWYRRKKSSSLEALSENRDKPLDPRDDSPQIQMELSSDAGRVLELFDKLGKGYRDIMFMRFVEDLQPREIAERLGLTANAVSVRISKGLTALKHHIGIDKTQ